MYNPYSLENKTILITGASSGIGRATAIECSKLGAKCIITGRNQERLQDTFNQLEGNNHIQYLAELTKEDDIINLTDNIPNLDGLVNNAGIAMIKPISFIKQSDFVKIFAINTFAPALIIKHLIKKKKLLPLKGIKFHQFLVKNQVKFSIKSKIKIILFLAV